MHCMATTEVKEERLDIVKICAPMNHENQQ